MLFGIVACMLKTEIGKESGVDMTLNQLHYFITVAQLENITKAAELLYLNQPALSKSIAKLEQEVGTPLFDRKGKKLSLNPQGKRFLEYAAAVLREQELMETDIRSMSEGNAAKLRIGAAGCAAVIVECAAAFRRLHPECGFEFDFSVEEQETPDINDYDVLLYPSGAKFDRFSGYDLGEEKYLLAVPVSYPLSEVPVVTAKNLADLDFVFLRRGKLYSDFPHRVCMALNVPFHSVCFTDTRQSQLQIIASGMAAGLIPEELRQNFCNPAVKLIPVADRRFCREMKICFRRDKHLSPLGAEFKQLVLERLKLGEAETAAAGYDSAE